MKSEVLILAEAPDHAPEIESLNALTFGPGRFAKTAYRLREGLEPVRALCRVAVTGGRLIGSVRFWPMRIGEHPALLLGPLCVHPDFARRGHGLALMLSGLEQVVTTDAELVILVGDFSYYARAGFVQVPLGQITLPGPVDPSRLLAREVRIGALEEVSGMVAPDPAFLSARAT